MEGKPCGLFPIIPCLVDVPHIRPVRNTQKAKGFMIYNHTFLCYLTRVHLLIVLVLILSEAEDEMM